VPRSVHPTTGLAQLSETQIIEYARYLSEDIGYRIVGTAEHAAGDAWMVTVATQLTDECNALARASGRKLECEVWRQEGSGSHRCVHIFQASTGHPTNAPCAGST
jgi:hypothetical protein